MYAVVGYIDLASLVMMLSVSLLIGMYFAYCAPGTKQTTDDYLVGGRSMGTIPIALSLIASYISGITMLGTPAEIYVFGCHYMYSLLTMPIMAYVMAYQMIPVFRELKGVSLYEYFSHRFNSKVRLIASALYLMSSITWVPIVIYVPALALNQVTGINVHYITPVVCLICIYYTGIGGIKAVVWTDAIQSISMVSCIILVCAKGLMDVGGIGVVWDRNVNSSRIEPPSLNSDLTERMTLQGLLIGGFFLHLGTSALKQDMIQRYLALPSNKNATRVVWIYVTGVTFFMGMSSITGLIMYAKYYECDPLSNKFVKRADQILPHFVVETLSEIPGLPGIFIAGVFSAALSSMSTALNSSSAVVLEDWIRGLMGYRPTERQANWILKGIVVCIGIIDVGLVFLVDRVGTMVMQLSYSMASLCFGPLLTLFVIGLCIPWVDTKGATAAALVSAFLLGVMNIGAQLSIATGKLRFDWKSLDTSGCNLTLPTEEDYYFFLKNLYSNTSLTTVTPVAANEDVFILFRISYLWYVPIAMSFGLLVAVISAAYLGPGWRTDLRTLDPRLVAPFARRWIPGNNIYTLNRSHEQNVLLNEIKIKTQIIEQTKL